MKLKAFAPALLLFLLAFGLPVASQQAAAPGPTYNIEVIIFRATTALGGPENWSIQGTQGGFDTAEEAGTGSGAVGRLAGLLPASQFQLTELANKLRASGAYVPVAHVAWSQTASAWGTRAGFPLERLGVEVPGLSGSVILERGQYLHLGMNLTYAMSDPPVGLGAGPGTTFTMHDSRRVRFYERNYYDHPAFGVIALVTPAQSNRPAGR